VREQSAARGNIGMYPGIVANAVANCIKLLLN